MWRGTVRLCSSEDELKLKGWLCCVLNLKLFRWLPKQFIICVLFFVDLFFSFFAPFLEMRTMLRHSRSKRNERQNTEKLIKSSRDNFMIEINMKTL